MKTRSARELLTQYEASLAALVDRGLIRTRNAVGDVGEAIAARAYGGNLESNSRGGFDFKTADGQRFQVKTRALWPGHSQTIQFKNWDFDIAVLIALSRVDFGVAWAREVTVDEARALSNGAMRFGLGRGARAGVDVTQLLRKAYEEL